MARSTVFVVSLLVALFAAGAATAARLVPEDSFEMASGQHGGLRASAQTSLLRMLGRHREREDEEEEARAYATIKFVVPPSLANKFEDEWLKLDDEVQDEKDNDIHSLKWQKLDNFIYISYGEWSTLHGLHKHLTSGHFERFSDWVDDHEVTWFLELLKNESEDVEEDQEEVQRHRRKVSELSDAARAMAPSQDPQSLHQVYRELHRKKELAHVLIKYFVPPGLDSDFMKAWTDAAESTIKEDGNRIYSLRKVATDNVRWTTYGSWESMGDFLDHWESKHVRHFKDFLAERDIFWSVEPLEAVGGEKGK